MGVVEEPHMVKGGLKSLERHPKNVRPGDLFIFSEVILFL